MWSGQMRSQRSYAEEFGFAGESGLFPIELSVGRTLGQKSGSSFRSEGSCPAIPVHFSQRSRVRLTNGMILMAASRDLGRLQGSFP